MGGPKTRQQSKGASAFPDNEITEETEILGTREQGEEIPHLDMRQAREKMPAWRLLTSDLLGLREYSLANDGPRIGNWLPIA